MELANTPSSSPPPLTYARTRTPRARTPAAQAAADAAAATAGGLKGRMRELDATDADKLVQTIKGALIVMVGECSTDHVMIGLTGFQEWSAKCLGEVGAFKLPHELFVN